MNGNEGTPAASLKQTRQSTATTNVYHNYFTPSIHYIAMPCLAEPRSNGLCLNAMSNSRAKNASRNCLSRSPFALTRALSTWLGWIEEFGDSGGVEMY